MIDDMKATLEFDLRCTLASPHWLDGYQHFEGVAYEPGMCAIVDVR